MVSFVCDRCQETLKKAKVQGHLNRCSGPVSCIDCSAVFPGDAFKAHTSCVSEAQKYEGALFKGDKKKKKRHDGATAGEPPAKKPRQATLAERVREAFLAELPPKEGGECVSLRKVRKAVVKRVRKEDAAADKAAIKAEVISVLATLPLAVRLL